MWGIFLESLVIFQNYVGYHQYRFLFVIYLLCLLYLWFAEKEKGRRVVFVYAPTLLLACFFCPLFRKAFVALLDDAEVYYRLLWLLQMSIVSAYAILKLCGRYRKIGLIVSCIAMIAGGSFVYGSEHITKAQNWYHLPQEAVEVAGLIDPEEGRVMALVPSDLIYYIRQYTSRVNMPYGREMLIARWDYYHAMYEAMEEADVIQTSSFVELTREHECDYVVLKKDREIEEPLTDYGFLLYAETENYLIYQDTEIGK
ncbi:MAG: hypothetical protein NC231_02165 [Bacillus sp. (in: Bacteria)]|nr:hypothetical protein [Bacillus sp. (in: firmicutes)]MCM1426167.1 hypothetical protein [Eubacterium sp.]